MMEAGPLKTGVEGYCTRTYLPTVPAADVAPRPPVLEDFVYGHRLLGDIVVDAGKEREWPQLSWMPPSHPCSDHMPSYLLPVQRLQTSMSSACAASITLPSDQVRASALPTWMISTISQWISLPHPSTALHPYSHPHTILCQPPE